MKSDSETTSRNPGPQPGHKGHSWAKNKKKPE